jgi:uncharacterized protein (TIGR03000 family)
MAALTTNSSTPNWGPLDFSIFHPGPGLCYGYTGVGHTCRGWIVHGGIYQGAWAGGYLGPNPFTPIPPDAAAAGRPIEVLPAPRPKQASAGVRIELPADARLFVDGVLMKTSSAVRLFQTPVLDPNQTYSYELKVELTRNNQTYADTQRIVVRPGELASASFNGLEQRAAAAQSTPVTAQR